MRKLRALAAALLLCAVSAATVFTATPAQANACPGGYTKVRDEGFYLAQNGALHPYLRVQIFRVPGQPHKVVKVSNAFSAAVPVDVYVDENRSRWERIFEGRVTVPARSGWCSVITVATGIRANAQYNNTQGLWSGAATYLS
jgi:hypothetical protein